MPFFLNFLRKPAQMVPRYCRRCGVSIRVTVQNLRIFWVIEKYGTNLRITIKLHEDWFKQHDKGTPYLLKYTKYDLRTIYTYFPTNIQVSVFFWKKTNEK